MKTVKFEEWDCQVEKSNYRQNNRTALQLVSNGELIATATINIDEIPLEPQEVIIKSYSENEGMYESLLEAGIIGPVKRYAENQFIKAHICDLKI